LSQPEILIGDPKCPNEGKTISATETFTSHSRGRRETSIDASAPVWAESAPSPVLSAISDQTFAIAMLGAAGETMNDNVD
jgi:hypothetical protein